MAPESDPAAMLGAVPIFAALDKTTRKALVQQGREMSYKDGSTIVSQGTIGVGFFMILDGKAEVRKGGKVLATLSKGSFFGEMSLIDDQPRSADVVAVQATKCWAITSWAFASVMKTHPEIAVGMLKELVKRLRTAQSGQVS
jgi:CRP/FNR family transcriptional regulator, cyclic AMP receptor protein